MSKIALYPGSFDPFTYGHLSLVTRGLEVFDRLVVAVAGTSSKNTLFTVAERREMLQAALAESLSPEQSSRVEVDAFEGLLVDYAAERKIQVILRGLRATADFEFEFQMALVNQQLNETLQTVFLMTGYQWFYVSSTIVRELAALGGDIGDMVPPAIARMLSVKFAGRLQRNGRAQETDSKT